MYNPKEQNFYTKNNYAYVHTNSFRQQDGSLMEYKECKLSKPGSPHGWEVRNEECCRGQGGEWNGEHQHCCFGELETHCDWRGKCETHCREHFETWKSCDTCRKTECDQAKCTKCEGDRGRCCGVTMLYANKTACLMYKEDCNDMKLRKDGNSYWDEDFTYTASYRTEIRGNQICGSFTAPSESDQTTILYDDSPQCFRNRWDGIESITEAARCVVSGSGITDASSCTNLGPYHKWIQREREYGGTFHCLDLNSSIVDAETCYKSNGLTNAQITSSCTNVNMSDAHKQLIVDASTASDATAIPTPAYYYPTTSCSHGGKNIKFTPAKFTTKAECDLAVCTGSMDWTYDSNLKFALWSPKDCATLSKSKCSRDRVGTDTEAACNSNGHCQGEQVWEFARATGCLDQNWPCGAAHHCEIIEQRTETYKGVTSTYEQRTWKSCNARLEYWDGVCVDESADPSVSCPHWYQQHPKGCRVDAPWITQNHGSHQNETWCTANGYTYFKRSDIDTKSACEAIKACYDKEVGWTPRSETRCAACGSSSEWKQRFAWNGGIWAGGQSRSLKWDENGIGERPSNSWVSTFSSVKMKKELQKPLLRMFSESKKSQMLLSFNYYINGLKDLACDCGVEKRNDCFAESVDNISSLVSVGTAFCGNEGTSLNGGCGKVEVKQACTSSRRRRSLLNANVNAEASALSFGHVSAGKFSEPICSESGSQSTCTCSSASTSAKLETMVVQNAAKMVVGQVVGDGIDFKVNDGSSFPDTIEKCLDFRIDINHHRSIFNTTDVAMYDGSKFASLGFGDYGTCTGNCVSISKQQICFKATSAGVYFPILRSHLSSTASSTPCPVANFDNGRGVCLSGGKKGCKCGFYGSKCDLGCENSCSSNNVVNDRCDANTHTCTCPSTHKGNDCSLLNCPQDENDNFCNNHGTCKLVDGKAKCQCLSQYYGSACEFDVLLDRAVNAGMSGSGKNGIVGMAFNFGWDVPAVLIALLLWLLILSPCCWVACCFYCPCCCRKKQCCCWAKSWGCGKDKSICACKCCHTHCEAHATRLGSHAKLMKHKVFTKFDSNNDGYLDAQELQSMMKDRFGAEVTIGQMAALMVPFDVDKDGRLTEAEYQAMLTSLEEKDTERTVARMKEILENLPDTVLINPDQINSLPQAGIGATKPNQIAPMTKETI